MTHWLYNLLMWLMWPLWLFYSYKRCKNQSKPRACWKSLWTIELPQFETQPIWIHAVSLGETQAALILINTIKQALPEQSIFFTGGNRSAIEFARKQHIDNFVISYLPLDYAWLRNRLFHAVQPKLLILMETEFWPNLLFTAHQLNIPTAIIQARLSQSSKKNYPKYGQPLLKQLLSPVQFVAAQTQQDADALISLGIKKEHCYLLGNIKYDFNLDEQLIAKAQQIKDRIGNRWIWVAGSTHPKEEVPLLAANKLLLDHDPQALLILVPRHPNYFETLAQVLTNSHIAFERWSTWYPSGNQLNNTTQVLLVDALGVLMQAYAIAQACFVGGSLVPWGGHNLLEPAALAKPLLAGQHNHNFSEIESGLIQANALYIVQNETHLFQQLYQLKTNPALATTLGNNAKSYFISQRGATERILLKLMKLIKN